MFNQTRARAKLRATSAVIAGGFDLSRLRIHFTLHQCLKVKQIVHSVTGPNSNHAEMFRFGLPLIQAPLLTSRSAGPTTSRTLSENYDAVCGLFVPKSGDSCATQAFGHRGRNI